jgi:pimeloyl-ACP methyl ester carboxylesterase
MPTIAANGLDIGYDEVGSGPPLVMLHGAATPGRQTYDALIPRLSGAFRLLLPDARGHGRTRWDVAAGFRLDWLVDDTLAFTDALGLETFHLAGYSMGGMTALTVAARAPARILTLVAIGISPEREPRASVGRRLLDPDRVARDEPAWAAELPRTHDPVQGTGAWRPLLTAIADDVATQPLLTPPELRAIDTPTLIACGDRDPLVPVGQAWALSRAVRDGRLLVAPGSGHDVVHERADLVGASMTAFYRSTEPIELARARASTRRADAPVT